MNGASVKSDILFSVIIPHYNSPALLKKLLGTIPADEDIQVIVVDDRSDSGLEELEEAAQSVLERHGVFLRNETGKKGAGTCRNLGLEKARGEWLIFADADDYFLDGAFPVIRKACGTDADLLFFSPTSAFLDTGEPAERHIEYTNLINSYLKDRSRKNELRLRYLFLPPWSKVYRRSLVTENHITFEETPVSNDVMFSVRFAYCAKEIEVSDQAFYCVTRASNTLTRTNNKEWLRIRVNVFIERYSFLRDHLSRKDFNSMEITGNNWIYEAMLRKYGIGEVFYILRLYRKNHIRIFLPKYLNLYRDYQEISRSMRKHAHERKHQ